MNRTKLHRFSLIIIVLIILAILVVVIKIQLFPFGLRGEELLPNTSINKYKVDIKIHNKKDFVRYLKRNTKRYELGNFMNRKKEIDWNKVYGNIRISRIAWKTVYTINYGTYNGYITHYPENYCLEITNDGDIRDYRSAGK
jgi:hypothetical protein